MKRKLYPDRSVSLHPSRIARAIPGSDGLLKNIAERLQVRRSALIKALQKPGRQYERCRKLLKEEREKIGDLAESALHDAMTQRLNLGVAAKTALQYLKMLHKDRGYGETVKLVHEGGDKPLQIEQVVVDPDKLSIDAKREILGLQEVGTVKGDGDE